MRPSAIRYYETQGVLPAPVRSASQYRMYGPEAETILRFVKQAKELGFSLDEIKRLIDASRSGPPCVECRELINRHIALVENELRRLRSLRDRLKRLQRQSTPVAPDALCPLIEANP